MEKMVPLPGIYYPDFIAANQEDRADHVLPGMDKQKHLEKIRQDIRKFKKDNGVDKVVIMWSANTERFSEIVPGVNDTIDNLMSSIKRGIKNVSSSTIYAVASILEGSSFINGSPQNTLVPGVIDLARSKGVWIVGDDFKTGQTKFKTAFVDYLIGAGLKPESIVSYNHLGNNDGMNLSSKAQFESKKKSKSNCVSTMISGNKILYPTKESEKIDHDIVIRYIPSAGDSKKAIDEYITDIFMGGKNVVSVYNVCEDSLLAAPIIMDLIILTELMQRIEWKTLGMK